MKYLSTRGRAPELGFEDALMSGLAPDGGLYLPTRWPVLAPDDLVALSGLSYAKAAGRIIAPFIGDEIDADALDTMLRDAYRDFRHPATAPLIQIDDNLWLLELFHGPTLAFKDFALQLLARLFDHVLERRGERVTVIGATSGDTGSAAIHACMDRPNIDIFILHPEGRVSEVQRRQMTTVMAPNVHNIAIRGTFDDCQALVKAMFNDEAFRRDMNLSAVNSINWARVMAQIVYYVTAAVSLGAPSRGVTFAVPTGNFGDVFAGYAASRMGLPIRRLIVATNRNDILARALATGRYRVAGVSPTISPSMDIQVASNFERLLFDLYDGDGAAVTESMTALSDGGGFDIAPDRLERARDLFDATRIDEDATLAEIARVHTETGLSIDPHTAVGVAAARALPQDPAVPVIALATAHAAKFPDAVERATGLRPAAPPPLAGLLEAEERCQTLDSDIAAVQTYIRFKGQPNA